MGKSATSNQLSLAVARSTFDPVYAEAPAYNKLGRYKEAATACE